MKLETQVIEDLKVKFSNREDKIKEIELQKLISSFKKFHSSFSTFYRNLCSEKIIKEDPYSSEFNVENLKLPSEDGIKYNEETYEMSIRLGQYNSLLNYLKENFSFDMESLNSEKLTKLLKIGTYINWDHIFHPQPEGINTAALNKLLYDYQRDSSNNFTITTLKAVVKYIVEYNHEFLFNLLIIKEFKNEWEKLWCRENILPLLKIPPVISGNNRDKASKIIKEKASSLNHKLNNKVIDEVLTEDFSENGEEARERNINSVLYQDEAPEESVNKKPQKEEILKELIFELSKPGPQISALIEKIEEDSVIYRDETFSIIQQLIDFIKYTLFNMERQTNYRINVLEPLASTFTEKEINLELFIEKAKSAIKKFDRYKEKDSAELNILSEEDEQVIKDIHQNISLINYIYKIGCGLDSLFKLDLENPRGLQIELKALYSIAARSQALYNELIALIRAI